ncbi:MAG: transporter substrate-binding domain-containing protein [Gemmobacter sp.]|jgi:ABC-type amino acid transport substrate-binding protein|nr:transporter substrate-binding domain-containing protein [Gemmobacter sp.]
MKSSSRSFLSAACAALVLAIHGGAAFAEAATDQVVAGKTITRDETIAALVPPKFNGALRFAVSAPYRPWMYFDDNNELTGIEVDVVRAIAAKLGVEATFINMKFDGAIPSLQAGQADVIAAGMGDTLEREKVLNFIDYRTLGNVVVVPASDQSINDLVDLCGKTVTRESGDVFAKFIDQVQPRCQEAGKPEITIMTLPDSNAALLAIKSGTADAQIVNLSAAESIVRAEENADLFRIVRPAHSPRGWRLSNGGLGVLKSEMDLAVAIEAALKAAKEEGTLQAIADQYGNPSIIIDEVGINTPTSGEL